MSFTIKHLLHVNAEQKEVFSALSTLEGLRNWWTVATEQTSTEPREFQFDFGEFKGPKMRVTNSEKNNLLEWNCIESENGWKGHTFSFQLDQNEGKTRIRFTHAGWEDDSDFYAICNFTWARYMESLRKFCQTGEGEAHGSVGYRI